MKPKILDAVKFLIGWPLSILSLFFVLKIIAPKLDSLMPQLQNINWVLLGWGIFCFLTYFLLRGILWNELLNLKGYKINFRESLYLWNISELKRYAPGNIWSFLSRAFLFSERKVKKKDILKSLLFESQLIIAGTTIVSLFSLPFIFNILPDTLIEPIIQPLIFLTVLVLSFVFIFNPYNFSFLPSFKWLSNLKLLLISCLLFFLWGLGNYFIASSLFTLDPVRLLEFIGFFTFSLLVGYISLVTPMGLGVREGILTLGFSKVVAVDVAGFISIFVRVVFILSELLFLSLSWFLRNTKNKFLSKIENLVVANKYESLLLISILIYFFYFTAASFARFDNFYTGRFDLGNMDQTVWNTIKGRPFQLTDPNGTNIISRLGFHADFILVLISPLYLIWSHPKMLLLVQTLILSLGAIFVFLISKEILKRKNISFIFSIAYLLNPSVEFSNLYDFHAVTFATVFFLASFYFLIKKRYVLLVIFLILAGLTKEDVWLIVGLFGAYILLFKKRYILGLSIFVLSLLTFYFLVWDIIPANGAGKHFALSYFSDFGDSPENVLKNVVLSPTKTISKIFQEGQLMYINQIMLPLGFLPLYSFLTVFSLPTIFINILSSNSQLYKIFFQYTATITPFLFISAINAMKNLKNISKSSILKKYFYIYLFLFAALFSSFSFGPLPWSSRPNIDMFTKPLENRIVVDNFLSKIPKNYSVSATNNLGSHLSQREKIFTIPIIGDADIILFLIRGDITEISIKKEFDILKSVKENKDYVEVFKDNQFTVFQKKNLGGPI